MNNVPRADQTQFYDDWVETEAAAGINDRHRAIAATLHRLGLKGGDRVLEVGCGVGQLTELICHRIGREGELMGVDLSPRSISAARQRLHRFSGVTLLAGDIVEMSLEPQFDVVVLPDVIEHIPLEFHSPLFAKLGGLLSPDGFMLLNYPCPHYQRWLHVHRPDLLQPVDQAIDADVLATEAARNGLYLVSLRTYSVWVPEGDYVSAVLRLVPSNPTYTLGSATPGRMLRNAARRLPFVLRRR